MKKKALAMALGAMMAVGAASQASAASQVDFNGYYRAYYYVGGNLGYQAGDAAFTDSFFAHRLQVNVTFTPTDEISLYWRVRGPSFQRWGTGSMNVITHYIYGSIKQDWGTVLVGRLSDDLDTFGLGSLGYAMETDPVNGYATPFDGGDVKDAIRYVNTWDNGFSLAAQYGKLATNAPDTWTSDSDSDIFLLEPRYEWDGGGVTLALAYNRDATPGVDAGDGDRDKVTAWFINPAFAHSFGDFSIHFEGQAGWGSTEVFSADPAVSHPDIDEEGYGVYLDVDYNYGPGNVTLAGWWVSGTELDEGYDAEGNWTGEATSKSLFGLGGNFYPLVVAYSGTASGYFRNGAYVDAGNTNAVAVANNAAANFIFGPGGFDDANIIDLETGLPSAYAYAVQTLYPQERFDSLNAGTEANHWALALTGNHAFTDEIALHWAVAYLGLNQPNYRIANSINVDNDVDVLNSVGYIEQSKDLGWEIDLGLEFQLLDNLRFSSVFGYMVTGDAFQTLRGYNVGLADSGGAGNRAINAVWEDADDAYAWYNVLQFSF
jgi:hypothetical protein